MCKEHKFNKKLDLGKANSWPVNITQHNIEVQLASVYIPSLSEVTSQDSSEMLANLPT